MYREGVDMSDNKYKAVILQLLILITKHTVFNRSFTESERERWNALMEDCHDVIRGLER